MKYASRLTSISKQYPGNLLKENQNTSARTVDTQSMYKHGSCCLYSSLLFDLWVLIQFKNVNIVSACVQLSFRFQVFHQCYSNVMLPT
jgi:hypothetical protein